jgi:hypothetical protein
MASSDDNREREKLAMEIAEAVRKNKRAPRGSKPRTLEEALDHMEREIWPLLPNRRRGLPPMTKAERAKLLGYGPDD